MMTDSCQELQGITAQPPTSWNEDRTEILGHGGEMNDARQQALTRGCARPVLQKVPRGPFVGGT
jgi:hypothetical protein